MIRINLLGRIYERARKARTARTRYRAKPLSATRVEQARAANRRYYAAHIEQQRLRVSGYRKQHPRYERMLAIRRRALTSVRQGNLDANAWHSSSRGFHVDEVFPPKRRASARKLAG